MLTSPYGLREVPHLEIPVSARRMADALAPFREETLFHRNFRLVPSLKTAGDSIALAMRIFDRNTPVQRKSYCEGVLCGGVATSLERYCGEEWRGCDLAVIVSDGCQYELYRALLEGHPYIREVGWLPISREKSYIENKAYLQKSKKIFGPCK